MQKLTATHLLHRSLGVSDQKTAEKDSTPQSAVPFFRAMCGSFFV